jgi:Ran GTPase-activating protein (RanGAP) involved in mRNA processing and transport
MATATEERAFLKPIVENFHEDGPRWRFAEYLAESCNELDRAQGEFIELQLTIAMLAADHPRRTILVDRQNELRHKHHDAWTAKLKPYASGFEFRRGLIDSVSLRVEQFEKHATKLFDLAPIRRISLTEVGQRTATLAKMPQLERVRELVLCGADLGEAGVQALAHSPYLHSLELLDLSFNGLGDNAMSQLAEAHMPKLHTLLLNDNRIGHLGAARVLKAAFPLRLLDLSANLVRGNAMVELVQHPTLQQVRLRMNPLGDAGVMLLVQHAMMKQLLKTDTTLDLSQTGLTSVAMMDIVKSVMMEELTTLNLTSNTLNDAAALSLANCERLPNLHTLILGHNKITDVGAVALARSPFMKQLRWLDVSSNRLTRRGIDDLWMNRADWQVTVECEGNVPGVSGPSDKVQKGLGRRTNS